MLTHLVDGFTHRQIAHRLGVATTSVDTYVRRAKEKLGARSKVELARLIVEGDRYRHAD